MLAYKYKTQRLYLKYIIKNQPITAVARSKEWTIFARLNDGIVGSNPTQGMDVCVFVYSVCVVL
jgi:hypothetical protein